MNIVRIIPQRMKKHVNQFEVLFPKVSLFLLICLHFMFFVMMGCTPRLNVGIETTEKLNSGGNVVTFRLYQLKNADTFQLISFEELWQNDLADEILKDDFIQKEEFTLYPDTIKLVKVEKQKSTKFIGIAAHFFKPDRNGWRQVFEVSSRRGKEVWIVVGENSIAIQDEDN